MNNFWESIQGPIRALAPMADVTDAAFRKMIATYGKPDVLYTEFVSADGIYHTREILKMNDVDNPLLKDLRFSANEHPLVAQLFTARPEYLEYAAALMVELGFDGVDINMGCPHDAVVRQGAGAALMRTPKLAQELIRAAKKGTQGKIPVSVKTRIGYSKNDIPEWMPYLLEEDVAALIVHARTKKELSIPPARWEYVGEVVAIRTAQFTGSRTRILGNGDVKSAVMGEELTRKHGADGYMVGRGVFGNPWFFSGREPVLEEKLRVLVEHAQTYRDLCAHKSIALLKKHFKAYCMGFPGAKELRIRLFDAETVDEMGTLVEDFLQHGV